MSFTSRFQPRARTRTRRGRLLVECLVSMLLLDASSLVVVSLARGAASSTQSAQGTSAAWSVGVRGVESSLSLPCHADAVAGSDELPLGSVSWNEGAHGAWRSRVVQAELTGSALTGLRSTLPVWQAARLCP